jgi:hypothetical protein
MNRFIKSVCIAITFTLLFGVMALAAWEFRFPIYLTDNTSTTRTYYPVMLGFGGQGLVSSGKIDSDGLDTDVKIGTSSIKYMMSTTNVTAVIPSLPSDSTVTANFYTGYSPEQTGFPIITGSGGYGTVSDSASLEPGSSTMAIEFNGYVDTTSGVSKYLFYHGDNMTVYVDNTTSGTINVVVGNVTLSASGISSGVHEVIFSIE